MYVRLAFAVAAHLSTEILLIDEVLAVGDVSFQKRCLGQIARISKQGRTILFVSHNLPAVKALCNRAVRIHRGQVKDDSESANVVTRYLVDEASNAQPEHKWNENTSAPGDENIRLTAIRAVGASNQLAAVHSSNDPLFIEMEVTVLRSHPSLVVSFELIHHTGVVVLKSCHTDGRDGHMPYFNIGRNVARCEIPAGLLCSGTYHVSPKIFLHGIGWIYNGDRAIAFDVTLDHGAYEHADPRFNGVIAPCFTWTRI
jgi:lipopolysaccharide transport system ATP-binding protein